MFEFLIAIGGIMFTYTMLMGYIPTNSTKIKPARVTKRRVNALTGTPVFEIMTFVGVFLLISSNGLGAMLLAFGIGIGLSLINKTFVVRYGKDRWWKK